MDIWIGFAVAALKAGVSGAVGNEFGQALANQGIKIGSEKLGQYLEKAQKELSQVLSDKSLMKMNVPEGCIDYVKEEIKGLLRSVSLDEGLFRNCRYDAKSLAEALYKKYKVQKKDFVEYETEIQKVLYAMSEKAISVEKGRGEFTEDSLVHIMEIEDEQMELLRKILHTLDESMKTGITDSENGGKPQMKKRLPDRTDEYRKKWNENMFLNDFDEDDAEAGVNIPLCKLHQPSFYRLKGQNNDLENLGERLDKCTNGKDKKNRMLLILGQPGMGKSTLITWFLDQYKNKTITEKREILVYRFTDLNIDWSSNSIGDKPREIGIDSDILRCIRIAKEDLSGKILILDGFDEILVSSNDRIEILNSLFRAWAQDTRIKNFSLLITCRENYIEDLYRLSFTYITLQPWNEDQIERFCRNYEGLTDTKVSKEAKDKMKKMKEVFGIPIILYMALALGITVKEESSVVEVYDQIFSLEGGIYDRCLKTDASIRWDDVHRISRIKKQIHQFSRQISMWMFENNPQHAEIPKDKYEKIRDKIFEMDDKELQLQKKDVLLGNFFGIGNCYDGIDTEQLRFVHRSIYEYFVTETITSEIREAVIKMTEDAQEQFAEVLGYRLKKGRIDFTIGQYLKAKVSVLIVPFNEEKKNLFYAWLEGTVGKMLGNGMLYYTGKNIKEYRNVIIKEMHCFSNLLSILRVFLDFSDGKYILANVNHEQLELYIRFLASYVKAKMGIKINLSQAELSEVDLNKVDLAGADLSKTDLRRTKLKVANLCGANLREANLRGAELGKADLREADLAGADLREVDLNGANLRGAILAGADLRVAKGIEADLFRTSLGKADLRVSDFSRANLGAADLRKVNLSRANLTGADLREAKLNEAILFGVNISGADLRKADLDYSKWRKEELSQYINLIMQAKFNEIYICSEETGEKRTCTYEELLASIQANT